MARPPETETGRLERDYARLEADFHTMADSIPQLAWMTEPDGWIFWYNRRWYDYTGTTLEEMQGWGWRKVHHPDHIDRVVENFARAFETGEPWEDIFPLRGKDGRFRWFLSRAMPIRDDDGRVLRWFGTNTDVTEQKEAEERQTLLMREIDHRAKNALAVAQAVVNLTRADTIGEYKKAVEGRIAALARAHSLLAASRWEGADIRSLVEDELAAYGDLSDPRFRLDGEPMNVAANVAQPLALVLHELATNAAKYGALSNATGRLDIAWENRGDKTVLRWAESGGPEVAAPPTTGFGSTLLDLLIRELGGATLDREWAPAGFRCRIEIPVADRPRLSAVAESPGAGDPRDDDGPVRVLVVEDEVLTALDLESRLEDAGYEVVGPVGTIDGAKREIAGRLPEIALVDGNLNGVSSIPLAEELHRAGVRVIFCTGYEKINGLPDTLSGCPVVHKPFRNVELFGALDGGK